MVENGPKKLKIEANTIGTHSGTFHADEVLACYLLSQHPLFANHKVLRTRDEQLLDQCDIVVDVGSVYDPDKKRFDHHQSTFQETFTSLRPELGEIGNVRLSSAGLIYVHYGETVIAELLKKQKNIVLTEKQMMSVFTKIYTSFIQELDGIDNGVPQFDGEPRYRINSHLSNRVKNFNPCWTEDKTPTEVDALFHEAKEYVGKEFKDKVEYFGSAWLPARKIVEKAVEDRKNLHPSGDIIELARFCPWQEHLREIERDIEGVEIKYVLFESGKEDYRVQCVPVKEGSFICRKFLCKKWWGTRDEELEKNSGIHGIKFCHATGFIGGNKTREGALKMAEVSLLH